MKAFLLLSKQRVVDITRSRISSFLFLGVPLLLLILVGATFMNGHPFERRQVAVVRPSDKDNAGGPARSERGDRGAQPLLDYLASLPEIHVHEESSEEAALAKMRSRMRSAVIVPPTDRKGARLLVGPREELFGRGLVAVMPDPVELEIVPLPRWGYVHYLFPGLLTFTTLIAGLFGMGYPMVRYRSNLFLKKLATTPLPRSTFIASQIAGRTLLVLVQMALMVAAGHLLFGLPLSLPAACWLIVLTILALVVFMGAGFALACVIRSEGVMIDAINSVTMPLVFLSEIFFSVDELPAPLPAVASALPSTQMVRLLRAVLLQGETQLGPLLPGLGIVALWIGITFGASMLVFRWHE